MGRFMQDVAPYIARTTLHISDHPTEDCYASKVCKEVGSTYSHVVKILDWFEEKGWITEQKRGRKKIIELTEDGERVFRKVDDLLEELEKHEAV